MVLPSYFIIDASKYNELPQTRLPEDVCLVFKITIPNLLEGTFYKTLFTSEKKLPFCLLIDLTCENEIKNNFDALIAFTFNYNYIKLNFGNPLIIFQINESDNGTSIALIKEAFINQGYNSIEPLILLNKKIYAWPEKEKNGLYFQLPDNSETVFTEYIDFLKKAIISGPAIFFQLSTPGNFVTILDTLQKAEEKISESSPQLSNLLYQIKTLTRQKQKLFTEYELLQEKMDSQARYNSFYRQADTRYKKQIIEIVSFYKNEYEVLPLWYKRLGHIIKVLMGKRTFKSLFDDNVKKYNVPDEG